MATDTVDEILDQWTLQRPDLDTTGLSIVVRVLMLSKPLKEQAKKALSILGLELWEYDVLSALRRQGAPYSLSASDLARATGLSFGAMTNRINKLEARRLVSRTPGSIDRRRVTVSLTPIGEELIEKAIRRRLAVADQSVMALAEHEKKTLDNLLRRIRRDAAA